MTDNNHICPACRERTLKEIGVVLREPPKLRLRCTECGHEEEWVVAEGEIFK